MNRFICTSFWTVAFPVLLFFSTPFALSASELSIDALLWVYVGSTEGGKFASTYFNVEEPPNKGQRLTPTTTMSLRASPPETKDGIRIKAKRISYLWPDMSLRVIDTVTQVPTPGVRYHWVGGELQQGGASDQGFGSAWFVVVASEVTIEEAKVRAEGIKRSNPELNVEVYQSENGYFAVVIGSGLTQSEAKALALEAHELGIAPDLYIWPSKKWGKSLLSLN